MSQYIIVGLIKILSFDFDFDFVLLLNNHFKTGIRDKNGVPEPESFTEFRSNPPSNTVSPFFTLICEVNRLVTEPGGASSDSLVVNSDCETSTVNVTSAFPDTTGVIFIAMSALIAFQVWVV